MQVLEKDLSNVKALFRRAQAHMAAQDYIEARQDLDLAIRVDPSNRCTYLPKTLFVCLSVCGDTNVVFLNEVLLVSVCGDTPASITHVLHTHGHNLMTTSACLYC